MLSLFLTTRYSSMAAFSFALAAQPVLAEALPIGFYAHSGYRNERSIGWVTSEGVLLWLREPGYSCLYYDPKATDFSGIRTPFLQSEDSEMDCPEIYELSTREIEGSDVPMMVGRSIALILTRENTPDLPDFKPVIPDIVSVLGVKVGSKTSDAYDVLADQSYKPLTGKLNGYIDFFEMRSDESHDNNLNSFDLVTIASVDGRVVAVVRSWVYAMSGFSTEQVLDALTQRFRTQYATDTVIFDLSGVKHTITGSDPTAACPGSHLYSSDYFMLLALGYKKNKFSPDVRCLGAGIFYELQSELSHLNGSIMEQGNADTLLQVVYDARGLMEFQWRAQAERFEQLRELYLREIKEKVDDGPEL